MRAKLERPSPHEDAEIARAIAADPTPPRSVQTGLRHRAADRTTAESGSQGLRAFAAGPRRHRALQVQGPRLSDPHQRRLEEKPSTVSGAAYRAGRTEVLPSGCPGWYLSGQNAVEPGFMEGRASSARSRPRYVISESWRTAQATHTF